MNVTNELTHIVSKYNHQLEQWYNVDTVVEKCRDDLLEVLDEEDREELLSWWVDVLDFLKTNNL